MALLHSNQTPWNKKTVLFVHGIGKQPANYSEPLYQIFRARDLATTEATRWHEVAYDSVNDAMAQKVIQFQKTLPTSPENPGIQATIADFLVDLVNYLFSVDPYHWINTVYKKELVEIVQAGLNEGVNQKDHEIYVISHSLGTVVSYEALHAIVDDAQTLGVSSNFRVKAFFTLGSPLAFIKANQAKIPSLNSTFFLRKQPIQLPGRINTFTEEFESNVSDWFNLQQKYDPVASLVPLTLKTSNHSLSEETLLFDKFHAGPNPHAFDNYVQEYKDFLLDKIRA